jgi:hypothetical protein
MCVVFKVPNIFFLKSLLISKKQAFRKNTNTGLRVAPGTYLMTGASLDRGLLLMTSRAANHVPG